jgi:Na+-driven multidrug efflux pump
MKNGAVRLTSKLAGGCATRPLVGRRMGQRDMRLLRATARGAIVGIAIGIAVSILSPLFFLGFLSNIPDFLWRVFPAVMWSKISARLLLMLAFAVYAVPFGAILGASARFLATAARTPKRDG